jgi:hypothetical protein
MRRRKRARSYYFRPRARSYAKSLIPSGGGLKPYIDGGLAGIAAEAGQKFLGAYGVPVGVGLVGWFTKNSTLKTIAGLQAGSIVGDMLPIIGGGGRAISGGVY